MISCWDEILITILALLCFISSASSVISQIIRQNHQKHIDKTKELRYTKLRCHGPVQHQHYSFSKVCAYGDTRKRKPFMCDNMYTECEKRTAKRLCYRRGRFAFYIALLPYVILIFFILHPPSIQQILSSLCTGKGWSVYANRWNFDLCKKSWSQNQIFVVYIYVNLKKTLKFKHKHELKL